jgi:hypothetical protein
MYQKPISISSNDPICSATSLEGTVIGILFDKSGQEIKDAVSLRVQAIDREIARQEELVIPIRDFLKEREGLIIDIEQLEVKRERERCEVQKPFQGEIEKFQTKISEVYREMGKKTDKIDEKTCALLDQQEAIFFSGWKELGEDFREILEDETDEKYDLPQHRKSNSSNSHSSMSVYYGSQGPKGPTGPTGCASGIACGYGVFPTIRISYKLKAEIVKYSLYFEKIKRRIEELVTEKRRLEMIVRNIDSDRKFKLNLTQLSAFGFEDILLG